LRVIVAGIVLEPSAALTEAINRSNERLLRLLGKRPALA
jgi:lipopolysaccharide export system permease protein